MNWQTPQELPDLRRVGIVALDTETNDAGLRDKRGSSWPWRDGYVCGISIAWREGGDIRAKYIPIRHPDSDNFDPVVVYCWLKDLVASGVRIVTLNGIYDWGWLRADGGIAMPSSDRLEEIGAIATLVDENLFRYSLDALCEQYGLPGKDEALLRQAVEAAGFPVKRAKEYIAQLPARYVGPYAEADAINTLMLFERLEPILAREGTREAYRLEVDLMPMVLEMRRRGIRIDQDAAEQARDLLLSKRDSALAELSAQLGTPVSMAEINRGKWKAQTFDAHRIAYPRTAKGNPSFSAGKTGWMVTHEHWLPRGIATASKYDAAGTKFLEGHILNHIVGGRIHAEIHPFRSDDGGTRSLRFSYSNPPLQQMPARDKELGPPIRSVFLPEEGEVWAKPDISQQEFRFVVHYAVEYGLPGATEAAEVYRSNPSADFHDLVAEMTGLGRDMAKAVNFAKIYGAGVRKLADMIGKPPDEAQAIVTQYDRKLPFVSRLSVVAQEMAVRIGHTKLYDGALRHWNQYEVAGLYAKGARPCPFEEAQRRVADPSHPWFGQRLSRANTYTALNALIQGAAARHTKLWMRACSREGIVPLLQMHDCLDCSVTTREQGELVARLGCEAVQLAVPMRVDLKFGRSWGDAKHTWDDLPAAPFNGTKTRTETPAVKPAIVLPAAPNGTEVRTKPPAAKPAFAPTVKPAIAPAAKPAIVLPVKPAVVLPAAKPANPPPAKPAIVRPAAPPLQVEPTIAPVAKTAIALPASQPATAPPAIALPMKPALKPAIVRTAAPPPDADMAIDLAHLIKEPVPRSRKICCPFHDEKTPSMHIYPDHFYCYGCGTWGDHVDWLVQVEGLEYDHALDIVDNWDGLVIPRSQTRDAEEDARRTTSALKWWDVAEPIAGTLAARYLADIRGIDLDALPANIDDALRFHPHCPFGPGVTHPCLIALMRDAVGNAPTGIQRIALTTEAQKIDRKMLGLSGVVQLCPAGNRLVIGEGLETTLAAATRLTYRDAPLQPAWAALSDGALARFPVIDRVKQLIVLADNDRNRAGQAAAEACKRRWLEAGRRVALLTPDRPGTDFNDIVIDTMRERVQ